MIQLTMRNSWIMLSMFLMSFLDSVLMTGPGLGLGSCGLVLSEVWEGEAQLGGETGGEEAEVTDLGVRDLKAEPEELGEVIEVLREAGPGEGPPTGERPNSSPSRM